MNGLESRFQEDAYLKEKRFSTVWIAYFGVLVALQIVLGNFLEIKISMYKQINLGFLPIAVSGYFFGPIGGLIVAGLGDLLGVLAKGDTFFPGFNISALIVGIVYGVMLYPRYTLFSSKAKTGLNKTELYVRALIAVILASCVNAFLNTYWISLYFGVDYWKYLNLRLPFYLIDLAVYPVIIVLTCDALRRLPTSLLPDKTRKGDMDKR